MKVGDKVEVKGGFMRGQVGVIKSISGNKCGPYQRIVKVKMPNRKHRVVHFEKNLRLLNKKPNLISYWK